MATSYDSPAGWLLIASVACLNSLKSPSTYSMFSRRASVWCRL